MFCCALLCVFPSSEIILMGQREREHVALLCLSPWCLMVIIVHGSSLWCHGLVLCVMFSCVFFSLTHMMSSVRCGA